MLYLFDIVLDRKRRADVDSAIKWLKRAVAKHDGGAYIELAETYAVVTRHPISLCVSVAIVAISGCVSAASAGESAAYKATVCDLLMHRDAFDAKTISIEATFVGGLLEQAGIVDVRCMDLGGIAVVNDANGGIENHLVNLARAMQSARVTSTNAQSRTVRARLVGTFTAGSKSTGGAKVVIRDATAIKIVAWTPVMVPLPQPR
jgi:hypothetical protein